MCFHRFSPFGRIYLSYPEEVLSSNPEAVLSTNNLEEEDLSSNPEAVQF
jgi:hypothetical protein